MPRLRNVWTDAWATLPDGVHRELSARGARGPNRRVVRVLFATVFGDDQPAEVALPSALRSPRVVFTDRQVESDDAERIHRAVAARATLLEVTADIYSLLRQRARGAGLSGDTVDEHLLRRACHWALEAAEPTPSAVTVLLAELQEQPSPDRLRALLDTDADLVNQLELELERAWSETAPRDGSPQESIDDGHPLLDFLDDEDLDAGTPSSDSHQRWAAALAVNAGAWHERAESLGLSSTSPPARPRLRTPSVAELRPHEWHTWWLDTSIEERVGSALRRNRSERVGLPAMPDLLSAEIRGSAQPLALAEADSRTVLVLGSQVAVRAGLPDRDSTVRGVQVIGAGIGQVRASARVRDKFYFWKLEQQETRGVAGFPKVWDGILADPTTFYLSYLWLRVHHDEIYGRAPYTAMTARWAVVAIASTVLDRLKTLSASQPQGPPVRGGDELDATVGLHAGRTVAIYGEVDRIRAQADPSEFARFFEGAGADRAADQQRWTTWTSAVGSRLALDDVLNWLEDHRPG